MEDTVETTSRSEILEDRRAEELAELVDDFVCEGEEFAVSRQDGQVHVVPGGHVSPLKRTHEHFYGLLLSVSQQLAEASAPLVAWIVRFAGLGGIAAIEREWVTHIAGRPIKLFQSWLVYFLLMLAVYAINSMIRERIVHFVYARRRGELLDEIAACGLGRYRVLSQIEMDDALADVSRMLKKDTEQEARY